MIGLAFIEIYESETLKLPRWMDVLDLLTEDDEVRKVDGKIELVSESLNFLDASFFNIKIFRQISS